jgi:phosphoadenosine phosphosulfate reductase
MYGYEWTEENGIYRLTINSKIIKEIRPVFKEELDYFGLEKFWEYPDTDAPLLWAEGIRRYVLNGACIAEAKGGGFYTKPNIEIFKGNLCLLPIDIDRLWKENEALVKGLEQKAISYIREKYNQFKERGFNFVVAFSGGKDSLVVLDLVSKALSPNEFYVVFSNTDMELNSTLESVENAKRHWSNLHFFEAESHMKAENSWDEFGLPGRSLRWCCAVHKSVPTILKLREITGNYDVRAVVFDGVRAEESARRSTYDDISIGAKNINQVNCSPILEWSSSELFIYILRNNILFNEAYRYGFNRVGCTICPLSSGWRDSLSAHLYPEQVEVLLKKVEQYASNTGIHKNQEKKYIENDGWRTRAGGRNLPNGGNRVTETINNDSISFDFAEVKQNWLSIAPLLGPIIGKTENTYIQLIDRQEYTFSIEESRGLSVTYNPYTKMDRFVISHLRGVANKVAYCIGCKSCMVQCPSNAFMVDDDGKIFIREEKCVHCSNCIDYTNGKGCLVAKSLSTSGGNNMNLKGMNRYQTFGLRKPWLEHFFTYKNACFSMGQLGNRQYDSLKIWLREAGLLSTANKGEKSGLPTPLFEKLEPLGPFNPLTWAIIWANLAYNSVIVKWYMLYAPAGEAYEKNDLIFMLGDDYSPSTRDNAVTALCETLRHSPIGSVLKQGIPIGSSSNLKYVKQGWETPEAVAILYSLYLWAEATGRYTFSLSQLAEARGKSDAIGVDPVSIYGLNPNTFKGMLQELALHYEKYLRVTFVVDLDTVKLFPEISSLDVLDLAKN